MGFGARGMAMGNAMTAISSPDVTAYYNPAVPAYAEQRTASATYTFLALDRRLSFLSYTQAVRPTAGLSAGIIYAGVGNIDGRDRHGEHTANYSTSEYQFAFSFSNKFSEDFSLGIGIKLYYYRLFEKAKTTTVGLDLGLFYKLTESISLGVALQDMNAKYRWDTSTLYGKAGNVTWEAFPVLRRVGIAYRLLQGLGTVAVDLESNNRGTTILRAGTELAATDFLILRAGIDRVQLSANENGVKPSFGFMLHEPLDGLYPTLSYAYVIEPFTSSGMSVLTLSVKF